MVDNLSVKLLMSGDVKCSRSLLIPAAVLVWLQPNIAFALDGMILAIPRCDSKIAILATLFTLLGVLLLRIPLFRRAAPVFITLHFASAAADRLLMPSYNS